MNAFAQGLLLVAVCHYEVSTSTGDHWAGGTDATVYITLIGSKGDCGKRTLYAPDGGINTFRVGQVGKIMAFPLLISNNL